MLYVKALHIIFIVTWFAGMFYMPRLFVYNTEAETKPGEARKILHAQLEIMMKRLWYSITIPSAILTLIFGPVLMFEEGWDKLLLDAPGRWLLIKLIFVFFLYLYFFSLHKILNQQLKGIFKYSSQQLRIWNEVATIFLVAIVMIAVVRESLSPVWGLVGLIVFVIVLLCAIRIFKLLRSKQR
jgi:protoporphyrinogen IX oxidase